MASGMIPLENLLRPTSSENWWIETGGLKKRLRILKKLSNILAELHSRGLVYGDLSPKNIFVSEKRYLLMITPFLFLYTIAFLYCISFKVKYGVFISSFLGVSLIILGIRMHQGMILLPNKHYGLEYYTPQPDYNSAYNAIKVSGFDPDDTIISPNPYIDIIYLGKADYVIPWSLTGREDETNLLNSRDFHSGAKKLSGKGKKTGMDKIESLRKKGDVYVVLDSLSVRRMKFDIWDDITDLGEEIFTTGDEDKVSVFVFIQK